MGRTDMQSVEFQDIDRLLASWDKLVAEFPERKAELLDELGKEMLSDVRKRIGGSGTVQSWQSYYAGSRLGYVAARPKAETYKTTKGGKRYAVGYVTNAIENGHRNRRPAPVQRDGYSYRPRNKTAATSGRHFYAAVRNRLDGIGRVQLERLAQEIVQRLEGKG